ncbi:Mov34/MPN/PAD-1 family protein [Myxococcus sp. K38C18041901]|uniref:Mov34/MPN/PAD-1 family protein n=1 Tax=Myxococcus guangdongensis TaxID=2906760 RepID=UPI0020A80F4C|nr:Mov34/MPN/PAD-1 family protein [Myxococcus guangdongensis]MCP3064084.1 Mov34/MPN/PAD-1 family protein [Myxococcus guangdongensis]
MSTHEVCLLIGQDEEVLWCEASESPVLLPDSRARWEAIWYWREELVEVAHSHPEGPLGFSEEDETTMTALTEALGRAPRFSVVAPGGMVARVEGRDVWVSEEPWWTGPLREISGMQYTPMARA